MSFSLVSPYTSKANEYKGQLHCHSTESDGLDSPTEIVIAYRDAGNDFVCLTDHLVRTAFPSDNMFLNHSLEVAGAGDPDFWANWSEGVGDGALANETILVYEGLDAAKVTAGPTKNTSLSQARTVVAGERYRMSFRSRGDGTYSARYSVYDNDNAAYISAAREDTGNTATAYALEEYEFIAPVGCTEVQCFLYCPGTNGGVCYFDLCDFRRIAPPGILFIHGVEERVSPGHMGNVYAAQARGGAGVAGQTAINNIVADGGIPIINHPELPGQVWEDSDLEALSGYGAIEIHNAMLYNWPPLYHNFGAEEKWDRLLSEGIRVCAVATDDCHDISEATEDGFNRGWVNVFADGLTVANIVAALKAGNFYSSTGPDMSISVVGDTITITTSNLGTIEFIGSSGAVLQTKATATTDSYTAVGDEIYVRIRITRDSDSRYAWTNPIYIEEQGSGTTMGRIPIITSYASTDLVHLKVDPYGGSPSSQATPVSNFFGNIPVDVVIGDVALERNLTVFGNLGVGIAAPLGRVHIDQSTAVAGIPVVVLDQADESEGFVDYLGTSAASAVGPISSWTAGNTIQGFVRTEINGAAYWMPYYDAPTS